RFLAGCTILGVVLKLTAPPASALADSYRRQGWWPSAPLRQSIERVAEIDGDRAALIDNSSTWTYSQLRQQVERGVGTLMRARIVVFTSGTTRRAKGVVHTLSSIGSGVDNIRIAFGFHNDDRPYLSTPLATITGVLQLLLSTNGASLVLEDRFDATQAVERIERHHATVLGGAPVILEMLFEASAQLGQTATSLDRITLGGTMIPRTVLEVAIDRFGIQP